MTAKERALRLLAEYYYILSGIDLRKQNVWMNFWNSNDNYCVSAKQCALIAVDEIIDTIFTHKNSYDYWQSVKEEINKL